MLKVLIVFILIAYVVSKVFGFLVRMVFGSSRPYSDAFTNKGQRYSKKAPNSKLNIEKIPERQKRTNSEYKGGDYIDFEEVK